MVRLYLTIRIGDGNNTNLFDQPWCIDIPFAFKPTFIDQNITPKNQVAQITSISPGILVILENLGEQ